MKIGGACISSSCGARCSSYRPLGGVSEPHRHGAAEQADELAPSHVLLVAHSHCFTGFVGRSGLRFLLTRPQRCAARLLLHVVPTAAAAIIAVARNSCSWSSRLAALILGVLFVASPVRPASHPLARGDRDSGARACRSPGWPGA